jgi:hypothetical protein
MIDLRAMKTLPRLLALLTVVGLVVAASATAAHVIVPGGTYKGEALKGASFVIGSDGARARFHGTSSVGLLCGPKKKPTGSPSAGQYAAVIVLDASSAPTLKINNATGTFRGRRRHKDVTVTIVGKFSADARKMVFTVETSGMCASSKYTFHSA